MKKKDYFYLLILGIVGLAIMFFIKGSNNLYGSETDWLSQHWVLPEYFRTLFYETGNLFPNYAPNLGAGQNIYNFSYYGLLNPIILVSYLLPFIKMVDYIIISSILIVIFSAFLFYKWLKNNCFSDKVAFISSFVFILANPIIFHSHRHIMFINYMPFIIMGLMGIDKYFKDNKKSLLILSVFLLIMTSYFYSVGGLIAIGIYGIYKILNIDNIDIKNFSLKLVKLILIMLVGILMAGVLLLPTIGIIANGRGQSVKNIDILSLLIPKINPEVLLYTPYALGFTIISLVSLIYGFFSKDRKTILLSLLLSIIFFVPIFVYLLNGMLYVRYKVLIPFAPLIGLLIAKFISDVLKGKLKLLPIFVVTVMVGLLNFKVSKELIVYFIDLLVLFAALYFYFKTKKEQIFFIPVIFMVLLNSIVSTSAETFVTKDRYEMEFNEGKEVLINEIIDQDNSYYRFNNLDATLSTANKIYHPNYFQTSLYSSTYNNDYNDFFYNVFKNAIPYRNRVITAQSSNILFQTLMGVKYVGTNGNEPIGYEKVTENSVFAIYKNENVFPLGYVTTNIMSNNDYKNIEYPYNLEPLLKGVVTNNFSNYFYQSMIEKIDLDYTKKIGKNIQLEVQDNIYRLNVAEHDYINLDVANIKKDQMLIIKFELLNNPRCSAGDISVSINNVRNVLTCREWIYHNRNYSFEYVISSNDVLDKLNVGFGKGVYEISNIETYVLDYNYIKEMTNQIDKMEVNMDKTKGDSIYGNINVSNDGYFVTSIPYDKGFNITLNGKKVIPKMVNQTFLGFPIDKGDYEVVIKYESPLFKEGMYLSVLGFVSYFGIIAFDYRKKSCK
ncbi:MAG: YfhO family protein [Bacilli bacterium]|nr:YfhO family protein [Bacilli bacterium]